MKVSQIYLNPTSLSVVKGSTVTIEVTVQPSKATTALTWESANKAVATVDKGTVTGVGVGTTTITATADGVTASCTVIVTAKVIPVTGMTMDASLTAKIGDVLDTHVKVTPADATYTDITFSSSNEAVVKVTDGKTLTAVGDGRCAVTAIIVTSDKNFSAECSVTVERTYYIGAVLDHVVSGSTVGIPGYFCDTTFVALTNSEFNGTNFSIGTVGIYVVNNDIYTMYSCYPRTGVTLSPRVSVWKNNAEYWKFAQNNPVVSSYLYDGGNFYIGGRYQGYQSKYQPAIWTNGVSSIVGSDPQLLGDVCDMKICDGHLYVLYYNGKDYTLRIAKDGVDIATVYDLVAAGDDGFMQGTRLFVHSDSDIWCIISTDGGAQSLYSWHNGTKAHVDSDYAGHDVSSTDAVDVPSKNTIYIAENNNGTTRIVALSTDSSTPATVVLTPYSDGSHESNFGYHSLFVVNDAVYAACVEKDWTTTPAQYGMKIYKIKNRVVDSFKTIPVRSGYSMQSASLFVK